LTGTDDPALRGQLAGTGNVGTPTGPVTTATQSTDVDGAALQRLLSAGLDWLEQHHEIVNALNVFPVPDGDTGTNMLLTMKSACQEIAAEGTSSVGEVTKAAAHGALMGARGNSGVILSQILRGMARSLADQDYLTGPGFAAALAEGSRIAYKGVNKPVEGTILTVVREAAEAASNAAPVDSSLSFVLTRTVRAADESVANTPRLLPILAQTGKVDSGGKGLFYILEGMNRALLGVAVAAPEAGARLAVPMAPKGRRELPPVIYGFDVQFLVEGHELDVDAIREYISAIGSYPLVEGDESLIKVHVHVLNPAAPLAYAVTLGFVTDVVVENMDDMQIPAMPPGYDPVPPRFEASEAIPDTKALPQPGEIAPRGEPTIDPDSGPGIVAVAPGSGLAQVFSSLGTHCVVSGGQTMNPSTQELLDAIRRAPGQQVIILPNNGNVLMAAQQAQALAAGTKSVAVVPSRSIPQGISALLALSPHADLEQNVRVMTNALGNVQTGEVTTAVQDAWFDGIEVKAGDMIGLLNDQLTATGPTSEAVVKILLEQMNAANLEVITLYYGQPVDNETAEALGKDLGDLYANQEIEVVEGKQPFYHYIISAE